MELVTTQGRFGPGDLGLILPHEHVFTDLGPIDAASYRDATAAPVIDLVGPELEAAAAAGVTALVECTPVGVGRRPDILEAVSAATGMPLVLPTGVYREPWVPDWVADAREEKLRDWMLAELTDSIEDAATPAAWIKLSAGDDGITDVERTLLRAAGAAAAETGALIGSHTVDGAVVRDQLDVLEAVGCPPEQFLWIHTQAEADDAVHREVAARGAWIEYDWIGGDRTDEAYIELIAAVLDAGLGDRLLLSQDRGWYDPSKPGGGDPDPYTYFPETFLPALRERIGADAARRLTRENPFRAFAR